MTLQDALAALDGKSELTAEDALALRRIIYGDDAFVSRDEAETLFKLNTDAGALSPEWRALFVEAMTDYVVGEEEPVGYVDQAKADWLIAQVKAAGRIRTDEVEMLIHVLEQADETPTALSNFVLGTLKAMALWKLKHGYAFGPRDVERLRRALYAKGGEANIAVTRHEAELLFDINDALAGGPVDASWTELFKRAVANAVLYETPWKPDAAAELKREAWLADAHAHPLARWRAMGGATLKGDLAEGLRETARLDFQDHDLERAYADDAAMEARAEALTGEEAHWLTDRIARNGRYDANERALVAFIRENAGALDPSLDAALRKLERATETA
jgi:hypothetical protein